MKIKTLLGTFILTVGVIVMAYGGFSYTSKREIARLGSVDLAVSVTQTVYVPIWVGAILMVAGGAVIAAKKKPKDGASR